MFATLLLVGSAVVPLATSAEAAASRPAHPSAEATLPGWLSSDQVIECATTIADGLRAGLLRKPPGTSTLIQTPVLENDTPLPVPDSDAWVRELSRAVSMRTGARIRIIGADAPASLQSRAVPARLVVLRAAENHRDVVIALQLGDASASPRQLVGEYLVRGVVEEENESNDVVEIDHADLAKMDHQLSVPLENGELRFEDDELAEDVEVTVESRASEEDGGRMRIRIELLAPDKSARLDLALFFLRGENVVRSLEVRKVELRHGRPKSIDADSELPADHFVLYFSD